MWCGTFGDWRAGTSCGCFVTDQAMIASTFTGKKYLPTDPILHATTGAMGMDQFAAAFKVKVATIPATTSNKTQLDNIIKAVNAGALVMVHGYGAKPFYTDPEGHWVVVRGVDAAGNILINDPQDLNAKNPDVPPPGGDTLTPWQPQVFISEMSGDAFAVTK